METNNNELLVEQNEFANGVNTPNDIIESNNFNNKGKKKKSKAFIAILIIAIVLCSVVALATTLVKSDEQKFIDLLVGKQSGVEFINSISEQNQKSEQVNSSVSVDIGDILKTAGMDLGIDFKVGLNSTQIVKDDNAFGYVNVELNDTVLGFVEYAKTGDIYGVKVDETSEKFLALENKDLQALFEKFEIEEAKELPNKFLTQEDFEKITKMKESDRNRIVKKYLNTILDSIKGKVTVEKNVSVKIGDEEFETKKYTLALTERQTMEMLLDVLKELKDDKKNIELVMNDVKSVFKLMEENGYPVEEMYGFTSDDFPSIDEIMKEIEDLYNEGLEQDFEYYDNEENFEISVYEYKGETIVTEMGMDGEILIFKGVFAEDIYCSYSIEEDGEELGAFVIKGTNVDNKITADLIMRAEGIELKILTMETECIKKAEKDIVELNSENALILNEATKEEIKDFGDDLIVELEEFAKEKVEEIETMIPLDQFMTTPDYSYDDYYYDDYYYDDYYLEY